MQGNRLYLFDGTYELFRSYFAAPRRRSRDDQEVGGVVGLMRGLVAFLRNTQVSYVAVAFDSVIESFRNELYAGYKSSEGVDRELLQQFPLAEVATRALGFVVWPMREFEADDAIATAAARWRDHPDIDQIVICSPDKDFSQCLQDRRVVALDRRKDRIIDEDAARERFGVDPESVPDWQALVGDSADGFPGISGWGKSSATAVLKRYGHLEAIPEDAGEWDVQVRGLERLSGSLREHWEEVLLYRRLATLRRDVPLEEELGDLRWKGATDELGTLCRRFRIPDFVERMPSV
ncbi:MAG: 5'-3' exonuclease H3TH domain-containing protein [Acidobacteriota bacterium]|jgi:5'-3' exonuclease